MEDLAPVVGGVRKLFSPDGRQIVDVNQLFQPDGLKDIIVVGTDKFDRSRWAQLVPRSPAKPLPPIEDRMAVQGRPAVAPATSPAPNSALHADPGRGLSPIPPTSPKPPRAGKIRAVSPAPAAAVVVSPPRLPAHAPLPPIAARSPSPELDTNTEFVPTDEPNPNLVENFLIQSLAPAVRANQERERQQRGYRMKMNVRAKNRLDDGTALVQEQQTAHAQLVRYHLD